MKIACLVMVFLLPFRSFASQGATTVKSTNVYEQPDLNSKILEQVSENQSLRSSNLPNFGFYRVRLASGIVGYVPQDVLQLSVSEMTQAPVSTTQTPVSAIQAPVSATQTPVSDPISSQTQLEPLPSSSSDFQKVSPSQGLPARSSESVGEMSVAKYPSSGSSRVQPAQVASVESSDRADTKGTHAFTQWKVFGNVLSIDLAPLFLSAQSLKNLYGVGGEGLFFLEDSFLLGLRYEQLSRPLNLKDSATSRLYEVSLKGSSVLFGASYRFYRTKRIFLQLEGFFGITKQSIQSIYVQSPGDTGGTFLASNQTFSSLGKIEMHWCFFKFVSSFFELGYRYIPSFEANPGLTDGFSTRIFHSSFSLNYSGFFGGGGLALDF